MTRLERVGYETGYRFVEKQTKDWQRFKDELDVLKFVCKEFWSAVFKKQIDNLRTNHQGVYVLLDNRFKFVTRISGSKQYMDLMPRVGFNQFKEFKRFSHVILFQYLAFACGMIRGGLANLGLTSTVTAEVLAPPSCKFEIKIQKAQLQQPVPPVQPTPASTVPEA